MAGVYNLEPPTQGKVVIHTNFGEVDIELWAKEAPKAVRNFVQLALEGYYDDTIFHRIAKGFMIQGGDPTGTGLDGESIYGRPFKDEFHSRLRFSHRGIVACANQNEPHSNGSQFFITLDKCDFLDRKHTIFGKVTGDTIFNVMRMGDQEVGEDDRPLEPPVITSIDVLWNPFEDVVPRITAEQRRKMKEQQKNEEKKKKPKVKGKKELKLLSFGDEAAEEESELAAAGGGMLSAHDTLQDARLEKQHDEEVAALVAAARRPRDNDDDEYDEAPSADVSAAASRTREKLKGKREPAKEAVREKHKDKEDSDEDDEGAKRGRSHDFADRMRDQAAAKRRAMGDVGPRKPPTVEGGKGGVPPSDDDDEDEDHQGGTEERRQKALESSKASQAVVRPSRQVAVQDSELLTEWQRKRSEYKARKKIGGDREKATLQRLAKFQQALKGAKPASRQEPENAAVDTSKAHEAQEGTEQQASGYEGKVREDVDHELMKPAAWRVDSYLTDKQTGGLDDLRGHVLHFASAPGDEMSRTDNVDDYVVIDPLIEQAKAKFNKQQKKRDREWKGGAIA